MSLKRRLVPLVLALLLTLTASPVVYAYSDAQGSWAADVIEKAAAYGLMEGYPDGRFGVGESITRSEFVTVLCRLFRWEPAVDPDETLSDVSSHWARGSIYAAAAHGAIDTSGAFRPDDPISRWEMAVMLVRALGYDSLARALSRADLSLPFDDVPENDGYIAIAYDLGIITGVEENGQLKFLPTFSAPREQAAAMLVRCYERYYASAAFLHGFYALNSYDQLPLADAMDAVSVGWARLEVTADGGLLVNDTSSGGNEWVKPAGAELVTGYLSERSIPCQLSVFATEAAFSSVVVSGAQTEAVNRLVSAARPYAGLTIDFEGLRSDRRADFTAFLTALRAALPAEQTLSVCVQPDTWFGGYDYRALGEVCDRVILMAHDYQWASIPDYYLYTTNTYCPVTPLDQVYTALRHVTDPDTGVQDRSKVALQISFNTTGFHVDEGGLLLDQTFYHPSTATIAQRLQQPDTVYLWDDKSHNPCILYTTEDGEHYKLWYEDAHSVADKLALARMFGVTGVSVWRLGLIPICPDLPDYDVWSVLSQR